MSLLQQVHSAPPSSTFVLGGGPKDGTSPSQAPERGFFSIILLMQLTISSRTSTSEVAQNLGPATLASRRLARTL